MSFFSAADKSSRIIKSDCSGSVAVLDTEHALGLNDCAWINNNFVVTASDDETVRLWDLEYVSITKNFIIKNN